MTAEELIARLRRNPEDPHAFAALRAHYEQQGDYPSLTNLLEGFAKRTPDAQRAADAYVQAGDLAQTALYDRGRSAALYERALERVPIHAHAQARLEALIEQDAGQPKKLEWLERRADALSAQNADPRARALLHHHIGELWAQAMSRPDRALLHFRHAFELDPSFVNAIYAAREIYRAGNNMRTAAQLYELEIAAEPSVERKVALLRELAHVRADDLEDLEAALATVGKALALRPDDPGLAHQHAELLLAHAAEAADPEEAAEGRAEASRTLAQASEREDAATAVTTLEAALEAWPANGEALLRLEDRAVEAGREVHLPLRWIGYLQTARPNDPNANEIRRRLGHAYRAAGQTEDAVYCFEPLLADGDSEAADILVELNRRLGRPEEFLRALLVSVSTIAPGHRTHRLRDGATWLSSVERRDLAAECAREVLAIDPGDPEALTLLEDEARAAGDFGALREVLITASRATGLSVEARKRRHREIAVLSEQKLGDVDAAITAWRAIVALDPSDAEARNALRKLLEGAGRYQDLAQVVERDLLTTANTQVRARLNAELAAIHRHKRRDAAAARLPLEEVVALRPDDAAAKRELAEVLLELGIRVDALRVLRGLVEQARDQQEKLWAQNHLADCLEALGQPEEAFALSAQILEADSHDVAAIGRMERIDERGGRTERLLTTLAYRADVVPEGERGAIFVRIAKLAEGELGDLDRAVEFYGRALDCDPTNETVLDALCEAYDRGKRYKDLVELLRTRAENRAQSAAERAELYRRIARTLETRVRNTSAATEAWLEVLKSGDDEEALRHLVGVAELAGESETLVERLGRLAEVVASDEERCTILVRRARALDERMHRRDEAQRLLRDVLERIDARSEEALVALSDMLDPDADGAELGATWRSILAVSHDAERRADLAPKLARLAEKNNLSADIAIDALRAWTDTEPTSLEPRRKLVEKLRDRGVSRELIDALDALADLELDDVSVEHRLESAALAEQLHDVDGAWTRLALLRDAGNVAGRSALHDLAKRMRRGEQLVEGYVGRAQRAAGSPDEKTAWLEAAEVYETILADPTRALEAALRALATDTKHADLLGEVERLSTAAKAGARLGQVYETLVKRATTNEDKILYLVRHGAWLATREGDPSGALDRYLRACALAPLDESLAMRAAELARETGRSEEMLIVYDRRRKEAQTPDIRVNALVLSAITAAREVHDDERAKLFLQQAVAAANGDETLLGEVEEGAAALDVDGHTSWREGLVELYRSEATTPRRAHAATLAIRGAALLEAALARPEAAFDLLKQASAVAPANVSLHDALDRHSAQHDRFEGLAEHFRALADEAVDSAATALALRNLAKVLQDRLSRPGDAADVYTQLLSVAPGDAEVPKLLRAALQASGRHKDLLVAVERELEKLPRGAARVELLKLVATTWMDALGNRYEARDAWLRVQKEAPDDADAAAALARIPTRTSISLPEDDDLPPQTEKEPRTLGTGPVEKGSRAQTTASEKGAPAATAGRRDARGVETNERRTADKSAPAQGSATPPGRASIEAPAPPPPVASSPAGDAGDKSASVQVEVDTNGDVDDMLDSLPPPRSARTGDRSSQRAIRAPGVDTRILAGPELAARSAPLPPVPPQAPAENSGSPFDEFEPSADEVDAVDATMMIEDVGFDDHGTLADGHGVIEAMRAAHAQHATGTRTPQREPDEPRPPSASASAVAEAKSAVVPEGYDDVTEFVEEVSAAGELAAGTDRPDVPETIEHPPAPETVEHRLDESEESVDLETSPGLQKPFGGR